MAHVGTPIVVNPLNKVWRGWPQKEHPAEQPLVRSLLDVAHLSAGAMATGAVAAVSTAAWDFCPLARCC